MLIERSESFGTLPRFDRSQPAVVAFIASHLPERSSQRIALEIAKRLFSACKRYGKRVPPLGLAQLESNMQAGDDKNPVTGWRYALPIALPADQARDVSRVLGAVVTALDPRFSAAAS